MFIRHRTRPISVIVVKGALRTIVVWLSMFALIAATDVAEAQPFRDFFRALSHSIAHSQQKPRSHRSSHKQNNVATQNDGSNSQASGGLVPVPPNSDNDNQVARSDASNSQTSDAQVPAPPNRHNVHAAKTTPATKKGKSGLLYGTPVPGKQGLVISPFSPDSGYIDVRSFPPGTEVKDPYTGKIFLTP